MTRPAPDRELAAMAVTSPNRKEFRMQPRLNARAVRIVGAASLGLAVLAAACGGEGSDGKDTGQTASATSSAATGTAATASSSATASTTAAAPTAKAAASETPDPSRGTKNRPVEKAAAPNAALVVVTGVGSDDVNKQEAFGFQFAAGIPGYRVEYVDKAAQCGSGAEIDMHGAKGIMLVTLKPAIAHDSSGASTIATTDFQGSHKIITGIQPACDSEGVVSFAVGLTGTGAFQVLESNKGDQLAILVNQKN
jgi:hypothetical protein